MENKNAALSSTKTAGELRAYLMYIFFTKRTMAVSNMKGGGTKGHQQLNPANVNATRGKFRSVAVNKCIFTISFVNQFAISHQYYQQLRPKDPTDLDFEFGQDHVPDDFLCTDLTV